jgi:hypothetical protein
MYRELDERHRRTKFYFKNMIGQDITWETWKYKTQHYIKIHVKVTELWECVLNSNGSRQGSPIVFYDQGDEPPGSIKTNQPAISCFTGSFPHAWRTVRTTKQNKTILTPYYAKKQFGSRAYFSVKLPPISDRVLLCLQVPRLCRVVFLMTAVLRCRRVHSVGIMTLTEEHNSARRRTCPSAT